MPWGRVDDTWYDHPKLELLEEVSLWPDRLAAAGLNSLAWSWCNRFLTDGRLPRATVGKLGGTIAIADLLVRVGLWEEVAGGYQIHDFLTYNDSRATVIARREKEAKRKADWRAKKQATEGVPPGHGSGGNGASRVESHEVSRRPSQRPSRDSTRANPVPSRPVPDSENESGSSDVEYPTPEPRGTRKVNGFAHVGEVAAELEESSATWTQALTLAERDAWAGFTSDWDPFRAAWLGRGFRRPPAGSAEDDPDEESPSQRALLWSILDARPDDLPRWVAEAPKRASASQVVGYAVDRWHAARDEATERAEHEEQAWTAEKAADRSGAGKAVERIRTATAGRPDWAGPEPAR